VLDQVPFPRLKLCAGWITPSVLDDLQVYPAAAPFGLTEFTAFQLSIKGIRFRMPVHQYAVRRVEFDAWLLERSGAAFAVHRVQEITRQGDRYVIDGQYTCRYLVGAGGTHCPVYRTFFEPGNPRREQDKIIALEQELAYSGADDRCHLWFFEHGLPGYSWYVPKVGGYVNIGIGAMAEKLKERGDTLKRHWLLFQDTLARQGLVRGVDLQPRGWQYALRRRNVPTRIGNALLAGDALGLATRDMGEGIGPAIRSGLLAAAAILRGGEYATESIPRFSLPTLLRRRA
jgi:flavin-dependent dehydrogenase